MAPKPGDIHTRARRDSGAARLWQWARDRRGAWTAQKAAAACKISPRRCRAIITALHKAGILDQVKESEVSIDGQQPADWMISAAGRALHAAPIMVVDRQAGLIIGVRAA